MTRAGLLALAWTEQTQRAREIAGALGGEAALLGSHGLRGRGSAPLRYLINAAATALLLVRRRPRAVIVQNPPIFAGLVAYAYTARTRSILILDSHPRSFGRKGKSIWRLLLPLHAWLARRADLVLVTVDELADEVRRWGGRAQLFHEAPPARIGNTKPAPSGRPNVLYVCVFASDEPVEPVLDAARRVPGVHIDVTGDPMKPNAPSPAELPENVRLVGFLDSEEYARALQRCDAVMVLTTEETSMVRAGYEAVYAMRPLLVSSTAVLRQAFPHAVHVNNDGDGIEHGLRRLIAEGAQLIERAPEALRLQDQRWNEQVTAVRRLLDEVIPAP